MSWTRRLDPPIVLPEGRKLATLRDAAEYVLEQPPEVQSEPAWQHAAHALRNAAEREAAWMWFARPAMMRAILGPDKPPIGNPEGKKGHRWRNNRKLARDR
ncbi:MAG: hypothetical protein J0H40_17630 [Rhizobiales bacterium]|nr:hypothetical protein [Hyphomicrobiales bacterium]